jgi:hypothetical protein
MSEPSTADWITAVSTALTAVAAFAGGAIAWIGLRRDRHAFFPIIEADIKWAKPSGQSRYLILDLIIRNQLYETLTLDTIRVRKPKGSLISALNFSAMGSPRFLRERWEKCL